MSKLRVEADILTKNKGYKVELSLIEFKEDNITIVYSPALDLSGYGKTFSEAKSSFSIALEEFILYTTNKNTLVKVLESLGWKTKGSSKKPKFRPPLDTELISTNPTYHDIVNNKQFSLHRENLLLTA